MAEIYFLLSYVINIPLYARHKQFRFENFISQTSEVSSVFLSFYI